MQQLGINRVPPGGWVCEWMGVNLFAGSKEQLIEMATEVCIMQGQPIPMDIKWQIEDAICRRLPPDARDCKPRGNRKLQIDAGMVKRFMMTLVAWFTKGFAFVPQEEATRRAGICAECPLQADAPGCWGCKGIGALVALVARGRTTPYDGRLINCGVCGCVNSVQVHVPLDVLQKVSGELDYSESPNCWKKI